MTGSDRWPSPIAVDTRVRSLSWFALRRPDLFGIRARGRREPSRTAGFVSVSGFGSWEPEFWRNMHHGGPLSARVRADYVMPPGADALIDAATAVAGRDPSWEVTALSDAGAPTRIRITRSAAEGYLASVVASGEPNATLRHPYDKTAGLPAPLEDWIDAIALADAAGRRVIAQDRWAGEDAAAAVERIEHRIVAYTDEEIATGDIDELRAWFTDVLRTTTARVEVHDVGELPYVRAGDDADTTLLRAFDGDEVVGWLPRAVSTDVDPAAWMVDPITLRTGRTIPVHPRCWVRTSGAATTSLTADHVVSWRELAAHPTALTRVDGAGSGWVAVHVVGSDVALVFPLAEAHVRVRTDDDGATMLLSATAAAPCRDEHRRRGTFEREWGAWLDPSVELDDTTLAKGLERVADLVANAQGGNR